VRKHYTAGEATAAVNSPVRVKAGERRDNIDFRLGPGASITGIVTDEDGQPLAVPVQLFRRLEEGRRRLALPSGELLPTSRATTALAALRPTLTISPPSPLRNHRFVRPALSRLTIPVRSISTRRRP